MKLKTHLRSKYKGQSGIEYLIITGFVTLAVTTILIAAYFYIGISRDRIRINQIETIATKIISSAESVFFAGEPSQTTITIYMPQGIKNIEFNEKNLIITFSTSTGTMKRAFSSRVTLEGSIQVGEGSRKLLIKAQPDKVIIS